MNLKQYMNKKKIHYIHRYATYCVVQLIRSTQVPIKIKKKMKRKMVHRLHRLTQIMKIKKISVNLYYYVAKPCFHSKIFPQAFAYSCSNNRLGVPPPLYYYPSNFCFFYKKLFCYCRLTFHDRSFQEIILKGFFKSVKSVKSVVSIFWLRLWVALCNLWTK